MATAKKTDIETDLGLLRRMSIAHLQALHRELFGDESPVSNAGHLRRKLAWHLQARKHGGLPESARQHALVIARDSELRVRIGDNVARRRKGIPLDRAATTAIAPDHDARLPLPGSLLMKDFKNRTIVVRVLDNGFEYDGRRFSSLSAIAHEITGTKWNGYLFFGIAKEKTLAR
jgi:hypothetical protein